MHRSSRALAFILQLAFVLRLMGIRFGLYHPDEHLIVNHALTFGTGDLNPHMFYFPTFFLYLLFFVYGLFYLIGHVFGYFQNTDGFLNYYLSSPQVFYVIGRMVSVGFGTLTVWVIYLLGKEYKNARTGVYAALFLAVCFLHSRDSHFATMDITLVFFMTLSVYLLFRYLNLRNKGFYFLAVLVSGAASAVKYNAFALVVPLTLAYFFISFDENFRRGRAQALKILLLDGILSIFLLVVVFFICSPYVLLDFKSAYWFTARLYEINKGFKIGLWHHAIMLYHSLGPALFVSALGGFLLSLSRLSKKETVFASLPLVYYLMITKAGQPFERYILAIVPFGVVWAAFFLDKLCLKAETWPLPSKFLANLVVALVTALSILPTTYSDILFLKRDTRDLAKDWIYREVRDGKTIVLDDPGQCPRLAASKSQIRSRLSLVRKDDPLLAVKVRRLEKLVSLEPYPSPSYNLYYLNQNPAANSFTLLGPLIQYDLEGLKTIRADYVIADGKSLISHPTFYAALKASGELVAVFDPRRDPKKEISMVSWTYLPIDATFWNRQRPGPMICIYKLRK